MFADDAAALEARRKQEERQRARKLRFRRALSTEAGREMLYDLAASVGIHSPVPPLLGPNGFDPLDLARQQGRREIVCEMLALAGIEIEFTFPTLADDAKRSPTIDTENSA